MTPLVCKPWPQVLSPRGTEADASLVDVSQAGNSLSEGYQLSKIPLRRSILLPEPTRVVPSLKIAHIPRLLLLELARLFPSVSSEKTKKLHFLVLHPQFKHLYHRPQASLYVGQHHARSQGAHRSGLGALLERLQVQRPRLPPVQPIHLRHLHGCPHRHVPGVWYRRWRGACYSQREVYTLNFFPYISIDLRNRETADKI